MPPYVAWCVDCGVEFSCVKNGVHVVFGSMESERISYVLADLYECPKCSKQIIDGWARGYSAPQLTEIFRIYVSQMGIPVWYVKDNIKRNWRWGNVEKMKAYTNWGG